MSGISLATIANNTDPTANSRSNSPRSRDTHDADSEPKRHGAGLRASASRDAAGHAARLLGRPSLHAKKWSPLTVDPGQDVPVGGALKRAFDIAVATLTLVLMAPIMLMIAALIYATQGGPVLFAQPRVGFNRKMFRCFKFRTMVTDAGQRLQQHLATNEEAAREWRETQKLTNDPRVTWLGQILRKSSLDELPQLLNVLRGDMSCIGPRPIVADEMQRYGTHAHDYVRARPGLTGMWQVSGRSKTTYEHRINCDRFYVRRWSIALDIKIMFRTIPAVLKFDETA